MFWKLKIKICLAITELQHKVGELTTTIKDLESQSQIKDLNQYHQARCNACQYNAFGKKFEKKKLFKHNGLEFLFIQIWDILC